MGKIISIEEQEVAGISLELFVISFEKDKMTLRVPTNKATEVGMRSLSSPDVVSKAMTTLKGKAKVKRAMWSRRAQEYEQKINSGDLIAIAEVVRDLHRTDDQREQSYSERQLYEAALERLTREVAAVSGSDEVCGAKAGRRRAGRPAPPDLLRNVRSGPPPSGGGFRLSGVTKWRALRARVHKPDPRSPGTGRWVRADRSDQSARARAWPARRSR